MAKKKVEEGGEIDRGEALWQSVEKEYGKGVITDASRLLDEKADIISTTPALDLPLSSGIPAGTWVSIAGPAKGGKSTLALMIGAQAQLAGFMVVYMNVEHRLKPMNLRGIRGLDTSPEKFRIVESTEERILSGVDHLNIASQILHDHKKVVLIFDSISALAEEGELQEGLSYEGRGNGAKMVSRFTRIVQSVVPIRKSVVVGITHLIANTSGWGPSKTERAANAWLYQADVRLRIEKSSEWKVGEKVVGQEVHWKVQCSALGPPGGSAVCWLRYGVGYDRIYELMMQARDLRLVSVAGAWYTFDWLQKTEGEVKFQGADKAYGALLENPAWLTSLEGQVKEMMGH